MKSRVFFCAWSVFFFKSTFNNASSFICLSKSDTSPHSVVALRGQSSVLGYKQSPVAIPSTFFIASSLVYFPQQQHVKQHPSMAIHLKGVHRENPIVKKSLYNGSDVYFWFWCQIVVFFCLEFFKTKQSIFRRKKIASRVE